VGFVIPLIDFAFIIGAVLATMMSGEELKDLGITRRYGVLALPIGLLVSFGLMWLRSLDQRFSGGMPLSYDPIPLLVVIIGGAYHSFAEEVLFRGYFVGRLSRDFGWVAAVVISGIAFGIMPFAYLGADPTVSVQISEVGKFFTSVFPALTLTGILLALVYRFIGNLIATWFGVTLSIWTFGFIRSGIVENMNFPLFSLISYSALIAAALLGVRLLQKIHGQKVLGFKEITTIIK
jgi:membrane protease YdiL (CAAX protease family)